MALSKLHLLQSKAPPAHPAPRPHPDSITMTASTTHHTTTAVSQGRKHELFFHHTRPVRSSGVILKIRTLKYSPEGCASLFGGISGACFKPNLRVCFALVFLAKSKAGRVEYKPASALQASAISALLLTTFMDPRIHTQREKQQLVINKICSSW